jgi:hypothetical protein
MDLLTGDGGFDQFESMAQNAPLDLDFSLAQPIGHAEHGPSSGNALDDMGDKGLNLAGRLADALKNKRAAEQTSLAQEADNLANEFAWLQTKQVEGLAHIQAKEKFKRLLNKEIDRLLNSNSPKPLGPPTHHALPIPQLSEMLPIFPEDTFSVDFSTSDLFADLDGSAAFPMPSSSNFMIQQSMPGIDSSTPDLSANLQNWQVTQRVDGPFPAKYHAAQLPSSADNFDGFTSQRPTESVTSGRSGRTDTHLRAHLTDLQLNSPASQQAQTPSDRGSVKTPKRPYPESQHSLARKPSGAADKLKPSDLTGVAKFAKDKDLEEEYFLMKVLRTLAIQLGLEDKLPAGFKDELDLENESIFSRIDQQHVAEVNRLLEPPENAVFSTKTFLKSVKKKIALVLNSSANKKQRVMTDSELDA